MPLGGALHGFPSRVAKTHGLSGFHRAKRQIGLHAHVQLGAKTTADRRRHDADFCAIQPQHPSQTVKIHDRSLCAGVDFHPVTDHSGKPRLRLDISMFDKAALEPSLHGDMRPGQSGLCLAAFDKAAAHHVFFPARMEQSRRIALRRLNVLCRGQFGPKHRKCLRGEARNHLRRANHGGHRFTSEPGFQLSEDRLILEPRNHPKTVLTRDIFRCQKRLKPVPGDIALYIPEAETGARVRRADQQDFKTSGRGDIISISQSA